MEDGFALRLQNLCDKHDYSYKEMSEMLGYTKNTFGHYARGERTPDLHTLIKIADIFQVSLDYLLLGTEPYYNSVDGLKPILERAGIKDSAMLKIENWQALSDEDIHKINHHFNLLLSMSQKGK